MSKTRVPPAPAATPTQFPLSALRVTYTTATGGEQTITGTQLARVIHMALFDPDAFRDLGEGPAESLTTEMEGLADVVEASIGAKEEHAIREDSSVAVFFGRTIRQQKARMMAGISRPEDEADVIDRHRGTGQLYVWLQGADATATTSRNKVVVDLLDAAQQKVRA